MPVPVSKVTPHFLRCSFNSVYLLFIHQRRSDGCIFCHTFCISLYFIRHYEFCCLLCVYVGHVCCFARLQSEHRTLQCVKQLSVSSFIMVTKCFVTQRNAQNPQLHTFQCQRNMFACTSVASHVRLYFCSNPCSLVLL